MLRKMNAIRGCSNIWFLSTRQRRATPIEKQVYCQCRTLCFYSSYQEVARVSRGFRETMRAVGHTEPSFLLVQPKAAEPSRLEAQPRAAAVRKSRENSLNLYLYGTSSRDPSTRVQSPSLGLRVLPARSGRQRVRVSLTRP